MPQSPYFTGTLYARMAEDLHLGGMSERTHAGYLRAVRKLADYCQTSPDKITEDQLRRFFLHMKNELHYAHGTLRVAFSGIKFFYTRTCRCEWQTLRQMKLQHVKSLPEVITCKQVLQIVLAANTQRMAVYFWTVYSLGLRMQEGLNLQVGDIDAERGMVHIHRGKGAKDRYIPLPTSTLNRQHAPAYLMKFGAAVPVGHRKVISSITRCRTGELGGVAYRCDDCGRVHWFGRSCGNRHCPGCGAEKTTAWLAKQTSRLLPVQHFLVTVTVPDRIGAVLRAHQRAGYHALFDAGAASIRDVGQATKSLRGCQLGFFGVLHTWGRDPTVYHPHVHFVVPGGGVKLDDPGHALAWQATPDNFLFHHGTLVRVYKAKLADQLRAGGLYDSVPPDAWQGQFVVDIQPVGDGQAVLTYLAPYVHRVAGHRPKGGRRQADRGGRRTIGDVFLHAVGLAPCPDSSRNRRGVRSWLLPARTAARPAKGAVLRLDGIPLQDQLR